MKKLILSSILAAVLAISCGEIKNSQNNNEGEMKKSNKQKVAELIKSIETGSHEPISYINPNKYIQHNQSVADGLAGFGEVMQQLPEGRARAKVVRIFEDSDYVVAHTDYNFFGPKIGIDIFRFENGLIVEHWDNLQEKVLKTASGHTQIDGFSDVNDIEKTETNKNLVKNLLSDVFMGSNPDKITDYISTEKYIQHNPGVKDGLAGLGEALESLAKANMPMIFEKNHIILGEGNFVLSVSEGKFMNEKVAFYDIFRIENGKVVEHWDTVEKIIPDSDSRNSNGKFNF